MRGQWIGTYDGSNKGQIVVNVDEYEEYYQGIAYLHPAQNDLPKSVATFRTKDKNGPFAFRTLSMEVLATLEIVRWQDIKGRYPEGTTMSAFADVEGDVSESKLTLKWKTDVNFKGSCVLPASKAATSSALRAQDLTWSEFKQRWVGSDRILI